MSKLLFVFEEDMPTVSILRDIFTHLKHYPEIVSDFMYMSDIKPEDIDIHDVIIFIRPSNIYSWKIARRAKEAGHPVITFCDDDLLNLPKDIPMTPWRKKGLIKALSFSDAVWSFNEHIVKKYRPFTSGGRSIRTDMIIRPAELEGITVKHNNNVVKIVYAAAASHAALFDEYVKPIVPELVREFGDKISFTFVGVRPNMEDIECEYISGMPLMEYRKFMREQNFDIGLAPLHVNDFSKCKYFNKFVEYTTQGIAGVYSNTEPYTYVVTDGENGFLANNRPEDWLNAMRRAIKDNKLREQCTANAIDYLRDRHSEEAIIGGGGIY